jgi:hypothetical protein
MSKTLFTLAGVVLLVSVGFWLAAIWTNDARWGDMGDVLLIPGGVALCAGIFIEISK